MDDVMRAIIAPFSRFGGEKQKYAKKKDSHIKIGRRKARV